MSWQVTLTDPGAVVDPVEIDVTPGNYSIAIQDNTTQASITPARSRFGTVQNPAPASTISVKYLWTIDSAWITKTDYNNLISMAQSRQPTLNATGLYISLQDSAEFLDRDGSAKTSNVRIILQGSPRQAVGTNKRTGTLDYQVSFQAWEI